MSLPQRPIPRADGPGFRMLHHFYYYCSAALIPDPLQAEDAPVPSPRPRASHAPSAAPRPQASGPAPRPPRRARVSAPAPPRAPAPRGDHPLPAEPNQQRPRGRGWAQELRTETPATLWKGRNPRLRRGALETGQRLVGWTLGMGQESER